MRSSFRHLALLLVVAALGCDAAAPTNSAAAGGADASAADVAGQDGSAQVPDAAVASDTTAVATVTVAQLADDALPQGIACDSQNVWYVSRYPQGSFTSPGYLARIPHGGGPAVKSTVLANFVGLTTDGDHVYWHKTASGSTLNRWIQRMPKAGGAAEDLSTVTINLASRLRIASGHVWALGTVMNGKTAVPGYYKLATQAASTPELVWQSPIPSGQLVMHGPDQFVIVNSTGTGVIAMATADGAQQAAIKLAKEYGGGLVSDGSSLFGMTAVNSKFPRALRRIDLQGTTATETELVAAVAPVGSGQGDVVLAQDGLVVFERPYPSVAGVMPAPDLVAVPAQGGAPALIAAGVRLEGAPVLCGKRLYWLQVVPDQGKATQYLLKSAQL